jgi:DNA-binding NarL/FixJ family response regulator
VVDEAIHLPAMIKLTIIDDNVKLARELKRELTEFPDIAWINLSDSGIAYANNFRSLPEDQMPDCVLMDISMKRADEGIIATRLLHEQNDRIKVVMFTISDDDERIFEAFKAGAVGYLLKNEKPAFIYRTIVDVLQGGALMSPGIALKTIRLLTGGDATPAVAKKNNAESNLTERELEVLRLIARGCTYQNIADQLFISVQTIKKHMTNIFRKLQVTNKIEAVNKTRDFL